MISTQRPVPAPHMHAIYTNLPATSRRANNVPFLVRAAPPPPAYFPPALAAVSGAGSTPRSRTRPPPRRNAISYHPSQPYSENPFSDPRPPRRTSPPASALPPPAFVPTLKASAASPAALPPSPRPRRATLVSAGHISNASLSAPLRYVPPVVPQSSLNGLNLSYSAAANEPARLVANMLLNRAGRSKPARPSPNRCSRSASPSLSTYIPSRLSTCVLGSDDLL
jgi:hypothetical protein